MGKGGGERGKSHNARNPARGRSSIPPTSRHVSHTTPPTPSEERTRTAILLISAYLARAVRLLDLLLELADEALPVELLGGGYESLKRAKLVISIR